VLSYQPIHATAGMSKVGSFTLPWHYSFPPWDKNGHNSTVRCIFGQEGWNSSMLIGELWHCLVSLQDFLQNDYFVHVVPISTHETKWTSLGTVCLHKIIFFAMAQYCVMHYYQRCGGSYYFCLPDIFLNSQNTKIWNSQQRKPQV
jgi:hypothetical protein